MSLQTNNIYEFENFRLDFAEKTLRKDGITVPLTPKVFETLLIFLDSPGRLIEKDELMQKLWQDRCVEESNLTFNIKMLRKAICDEASNPRFIVTVPKRGYRFIANVRRIETGGSNGSKPNTYAERKTRIGLEPLAEPRRHVKEPRARHNRGVALSAIVIASTALVFYVLLSGQAASPAATPEKTIAVLPLQPIDPEGRDAIFEVGIADALINKINSMNGVFARPLSSVRQYSSPLQDPYLAGKEQQVDYVLTSNYQLSDKKIRVTWQLLNVASNQLDENQTTDGYVGDVFSMHDAIASEIGDVIATRFAAKFDLKFASRGTDNEEAYRLYLQGMYLYDRRTVEGASNAVEKLKSAIELDNNYARAWAGLAHAHRSLGNFGGSKMPHEEYSRSMEAISMALALDENSSDAYSALCENQFYYEYDFQKAEISCRRALELDPRSFLAHEIYSRCLWTLGRLDDALEQAKIAIDLRPTALFTQRNYGITLFYARRQSEAMHQFQRVSDMDPSFVANYAWFIPALLSNGKEPEAFEWFIKWQTRMNLDETAIHAYKQAYQISGWKGVGEERVSRFNEDKIRSYFLEACLMAHTGNKDKTFEYLEKSYLRREWGIPFLQIDPSLDGIRDDRRFEDLVRRVQTKPDGKAVF